MSEIKQMIIDGSSTTFDFVPNTEDYTFIATTIVAFANSQGGRLLVGVKMNGKISGTNPPEELQSIQDIVDASVKPSLVLTSKIWQEEHYLLLEVIVPRSNSKHKALEKEGEWKYYYRVDSSNLPANKVVHRVWHHQSIRTAMPNQLTAELSDFKDLIEKNGPVSLSQLYKLSKMGKNIMNELLAKLIHWEVVEQRIEDSLTVYFVSD